MGVFQIRMFAGNIFDEEDLIRRFLDGMRVDQLESFHLIWCTSPHSHNITDKVKSLALGDQLASHLRTS